MKEVNSVRYAEAKLAYKIRYTGSKLPVIWRHVNISFDRLYQDH